MLHYDEKIESRSGSLKALDYEKSYTVWGDSDTDDDDDQLIAGALGASPAYVDIDGSRIYRQDVRWDPTGHLMWDLVIPYGKNSEIETGSVSFNFDTTGGTTTLKCAKQHINSYPAPGQTATNHHGAIGVTKDGAEGTEIVIPSLRITATYTQPQGVVTSLYMMNLARFTGTVNDMPFRGFNRGELLFIGASGGDGSDTPATVSYNFIASGDATGLSFGDIVNVAKKGHEIAWVEFMEKPEGGKPSMQPLAVHVERVYDYVDFEAVFGWS